MTTEDRTDRLSATAFRITLLTLTAVSVIPAMPCSTPYYERAVDPPAFSHGIGIAPKLERFGYGREMYAYMFGPELTGYARLRAPGRVSLSGQLDIEHQWAVYRFNLPKTYSSTSATLTGGVKIGTWKHGAVAAKGGAYVVRVKTPWMYESSYFPVLDLSMLQDFGNQNPVTARLTVGVGGFQFGLGAERQVSRSLVARLSAGVTLDYLGSVPFSFADAHLGLAIEPVASQD